MREEESKGSGRTGEECAKRKGCPRKITSGVKRRRGEGRAKTKDFRWNITSGVKRSQGEGVAKTKRRGGEGKPKGKPAKGLFWFLM